MKSPLLALVPALTMAVSVSAGPLTIDFTNRFTDVDALNGTPQYHAIGSYWSLGQSYLSLDSGALRLGASAAVTTDDSFSITCYGTKKSGCGSLGIGMRSQQLDLDPFLVDNVPGLSTEGAGEILSLDNLYNDPTLLIRSITFSTPLGRYFSDTIDLYVDSGPLLAVKSTASTLTYTFANPTTFSEVVMQADSIQGFALKSITLEQTPEPGSLILLLSGLVACAARKRGT